MSDLAKYLVADQVVKIDNGRTLRSYLKILNIHGKVSYSNLDQSWADEEGPTSLYWYVANTTIYFEYVDVLVTAGQDFALVIKRNDEDRFHDPPHDYCVPFAIRVMEGR